MNDPVTQLTHPKLLIGEGSDDLRFLQAFLKFLEIGDVQVEQYGGKGNLSSYLKTLKLLPGFSKLVSLAITRDADKQANRAFQSICGFLKNRGYATPTKVEQVKPGTPNISVFLFPDGTNPGMLEDLCLSSVKNDPAMTCIDGYFECVEQQASRQPKNMAKAKLHAFLASQTKPSLRLAEAAEKGVWKWDSPAFDRLKQFLQSI
ncbi:MAG: DUF3226 domain-containing protein [Cyanobacteriota bacterium]|nr:DUF3226 domain-containing protein [Cyanobacteriota bacterium]